MNVGSKIWVVPIACIDSAEGRKGIIRNRDVVSMREGIELWYSLTGQSSFFLRSIIRMRILHIINNIQICGESRFW